MYEIEHKVQDAIQKATDDPAVWRELTSRHQAELNIVAYVWQWNLTIQLSTDTIRCLARRNITFSLDLQAPLTAPGSWG